MQKREKKKRKEKKRKNNSLQLTLIKLGDLSTLISRKLNLYKLNTTIS
jgi:hypothetical protein